MDDNRKYPIGISRVWCRPPRRKPFEVFQVSGVPNGIRKCWKVCIAPRGERRAFQLAKAKRAEWAAQSRKWGSGREARIRIDASSVPTSMKFPGLQICRHRALVMATRGFQDSRGIHRRIYLCYPYSLEGGSLPDFLAALEMCRRGQGVLNALNAGMLERAWFRHKAANRARKRGENMSNALLTFDAFKSGFVSKREVAAFNHAYERKAA